MFISYGYPVSVGAWLDVEDMRVIIISEYHNWSSYTTWPYVPSYNKSYTFYKITWDVISFFCVSYSHITIILNARFPQLRIPIYPMKSVNINHNQNLKILLMSSTSENVIFKIEALIKILHIWWIHRKNIWWDDYFYYVEYSKCNVLININELTRYCRFNAIK